MRRGSLIFNQGISVTQNSLALQVVGTGGFLSDTTVITPTAANARRTYRASAFLGADATAFRIAFPGWHRNAVGVEVGLGNDQIVEAALEIAGTTVAFTWNGGSSTGTIVDGTALYMSDLLPANAFGSSTIARGTQVFQRFNIDVSASSGNMFDFNNETGSSTITAVSMAAGVPSQVTGTGALTVGGSYTAITAYQLPLALLGTTTQPVPAILIVGDSIARGHADTSGSGTGGFLSRGIDSMSKVVPYVNVGTSGTQIIQVAATEAQVLSSKLAALFPHVGVVINEYGHNDIRPGGTAAAILSHLKNMALAAKTFPNIKKVVEIVITPDTSSTDSWATPTSPSPDNQTPTTQFGIGGQRDQLNTLILSEPSFDAVIDTRPAIQSPFDTAAWIANGTSNYATADGTHPSAAASALMAPSVTAILNGLGLY